MEVEDRFHANLSSSYIRTTLYEKVSVFNLLFTHICGQIIYSKCIFKVEKRGLKGIITFFPTFL